MEFVDLSIDDSEIEIPEIRPSLIETTTEIKPLWNELKKYIPFLQYVYNLDPVSNTNFIKIANWLNKQNTTFTDLKLQRCEFIIKNEYRILKNKTIIPKHITEIFEGETTLIVISDEEDQPSESYPTISKEDDTITKVSPTENQPKTVITAEPSSSIKTKTCQNLESSKQSKIRRKGKKGLSSRRKKTKKFQKKFSRTIKRKNHINMEYSHRKRINNNSKPDACVFDILSWQDLEKQNQGRSVQPENYLLDISLHQRSPSCENRDRFPDYESPKKKKKRHNRRDNRNQLSKTPDSYLPDLENTVDMEQGIQNQSFEDLLEQKRRLENELLQIEDKETDVLKDVAPCVLPKKSDTELFQRRNSVVRCDRNDFFLESPYVGPINSVLQKDPKVVAEIVQNSQTTKIVYDYTNVTKTHNSNALRSPNTLPTQSKSNIIQLPNKIIIDIDDVTLSNLNAIVASSHKSCEMNNNICPKSNSGDAYRKAMQQEQNVLKSQESMQHYERSLTHQKPQSLPKQMNTKSSPYKMNCSSVPSCLNKALKSPDNNSSHLKNPFKSTNQVVGSSVGNVNPKPNRCAQLEPSRTQTQSLAQVNSKSGEHTRKRLSDLENSKQTKSNNVKNSKSENKQTKSDTTEKEMSKKKPLERKPNRPSSSKTIETGKSSSKSKRNPIDDEEVIMSFPSRLKSKRRIESWSSSEDFEPSTVKTAPRNFSTPSKIGKSKPASSPSSSTKISVSKSKDTRQGLGSDSNEKKTKKDRPNDKTKSWKRIQIADHDDSPKKKLHKTEHSTAEDHTLKKQEAKTKETSQKRPEKENKDQESTNKTTYRRRLYRELSNLTCTFKESLLPASIGRRRRCSSISANSLKKSQQKQETIVSDNKLTAAPIQRRRQTAWPSSEKQEKESLNVERFDPTALPIARRRKTCSSSHPIRLNIGLSTDRKEYCVKESPESSNTFNFFNRIPKVSLKRLPESSYKSMNTPTAAAETEATLFNNVDIKMTYKSTKTCALCNKKPHDLTNHYVAHHNSESYISRLSSAEIAKLQESDNLAIPCRKNRYRTTCAFCKEELEESFENLRAHFSYHTGEYNFQCGGCKILKPYKSDVGSHQQRTRMCRNSRIRTLSHYETGLATIYLCVCKLCNFGNMNEANVGRHLRNEHGLKPDEEQINIKKFILVTKDLGKSSDSSPQSPSNEIGASSLSPEMLMEKLHAQNTSETKLMALSSLDNSICQSPEIPSSIKSNKSTNSSKQVQENNTVTKLTALRSFEEPTCKSPERLLEELHAEDSLISNSKEIRSSNEDLNQNTEMLLDDLQNSQTLSNIMTVTQNSDDLILEEVQHDSNSITTVKSKGANESIPIIVKVTTEAPCGTPEILLEELHASTSSKNTMLDDLTTSNNIILEEVQHDSNPITAIESKGANRSMPIIEEVTTEAACAVPEILLEELHASTSSKNTISGDITSSNKHVSESLLAAANSHNSGTTQVARTNLTKPLTESRIESTSKHSMNYRQYNKFDPNNFGLLKCTIEDCLFSTNSDDEFRMHMLNNHIENNGPKKCHCPYCVEEIYSLENLMCHIWRQHGMSKYQCVECSYRSVVPGNVIIHRIMCHNNKNTTKPIYKCFSREANQSKPRAVYEKVKANVASLKCPDCSSSFYALASIKSHIQKSHPLTFQKFNSLKLNEFACIHCKRESNCKERMQIHMMLHHPDETGVVIKRILVPEDCGDSLENLVLADISPGVSVTHIEGEETPKKDATKAPSRSQNIIDVNHSPRAKESPSGITLIPASTIKKHAKVKQGSAVKKSFKNPRLPLQNKQPKSKKDSLVKQRKFGETFAKNSKVFLKNQQPKVKEGTAMEIYKPVKRISNKLQALPKNQQPKVKDILLFETIESEATYSNNPQVPLQNQELRVEKAKTPQMPPRDQRPTDVKASPMETNKSGQISLKNPQVLSKGQQPGETENSPLETSCSEEKFSKNPQVPPKNQQPKEIEDSPVETNSEKTSFNNPKMPLKDQKRGVTEDSSLETSCSEEKCSKNPQVPPKNQQPKEIEDSPVETNSEKTSFNNPKMPLKDQQPREVEDLSVETNHSEESSCIKPKAPSTNQHPKQKDASAVEANKCKEASSNNPEVPPLCDQQPKENDGLALETIKSSNDHLPFKNQQPHWKPEASVKPCEPVVNPGTCDIHHNEPSSPFTIVIDDDYDEDQIVSDQMQIQSPTCLEKKENPASVHWNAAIIKEVPRIGPLLELLVENTGIHSSTLYKCSLCIASFMHFELWLTHLKNKHKITSDVHCPYCNIELAPDSAEDHFQSHRRHEYICYYCIASFCSIKKIHEHFALCHESHSTVEHKAADFFVLMNQDVIITDFTALLEEFVESIYNNLTERIQRHTINEWLPGLTDSCFYEIEVPKYTNEGRPLFKCLLKFCSFIGSDESSFDSHLIQHEVPKSFACSHCLFRLDKPSWESIKFHFLLHQSPSLHICCVCKFVHYNSKGMTKHIDSFHNSRDVPVLCLSRNHSSFKASLSVLLPQNEMTFTTSKACFCCSMEISNSSKFINHLKKEHRISFCPRCRICDKIILTQFEAENHFKDNHQMETFQLKFEVLTPYLYDLTVKSMSPLAIEMSIQKRNRDRQSLVSNECTSVRIKEEVVVVKDEFQEKPKSPSISLKCLNTHQLMANPTVPTKSNVTESTTMTLPFGNTSIPTTGQSFSPILIPAHSQPTATTRHCLRSLLTANPQPYSFAQQTVATDMSLPHARAVQQTTSPTDTRYSSPSSQLHHSIPVEAPLTNRSLSTASIHHSLPYAYVPHSMPNILHSSTNQAITSRVIQHTSDVQHTSYSSSSMHIHSTTIGQSLPSTNIQYSTMLATTLRNSLPNQPLQHSTPGMDARYSSASFLQPLEAPTPLRNSTSSTSTRHSSQHRVISEVQLGNGSAVISIPPSAFQATPSPTNQLESVVRTAGTASIPQPSINTIIQPQRNCNASNLDELVPFCGSCYLECSDFDHLISHYEAVHLRQQERFYFYVSRKIACMNCHYQGSDKSFSRHHATYHPDQSQLLCCSVKDARRCGLCNDIFSFLVPSVNRQRQSMCGCPTRKRVLADCLDLRTLSVLRSIGSQYFKYSCDFCSGCFENFHQYREHFERVHQQYVEPGMSNARAMFYCSKCSTVKSYKIVDIVHHIRRSHVRTLGITPLEAYNQFYKRIRRCYPNGFTIYIEDLCNTEEFDEETFKREIYLYEVSCQNALAIN